jgi:hypothetical protein
MSKLRSLYKAETGLLAKEVDLDQVETLVNEEGTVEFEPLFAHPVIVPKSYLDWLEEKASNGS